MKMNEKLEQALKLAKVQCVLCNIPYGNILKIEPNTRAKRRWGQCKKVPGGFEINISTRLLVDDVDEKSLMDTVLHEVLHTCPNCMNHGKTWKEYARRLNKKFGYDIKRCTSSEEKGIEPTSREQDYKYIVKCENCNLKYYYLRRGEVIRQIQANPNHHRCSCGRCRSNKLVVIKL